MRLHSANSLGTSNKAAGGLMRVRKLALKHGGDLVLVAPPERVSKVLEILRLDDWFRIFPDEDAAVRYLGGEGPGGDDTCPKGAPLVPRPSEGEAAAEVPEPE